jgi:hypothetical protein
MKANDIDKKVTQGSIHHLLTWAWNNDEYYELALERAAIVAAQKLAFWRKYPIFGNLRVVRIVSGFYFELRAFLAYEGEKGIGKFRTVEIRKLGCTKVFM